LFFFSFSAQRGPRRAEPARPGLPRAHRPHPGRNLGLGRQSAARARSRLGLDLAQRITAVRVYPTAERLFRAEQNAAAADALETLGIRLFPSLSPRCLPLLSRSGDGHRRAAASEENRSELWRRRWPPRRRACSPTGEHAAVERPSRGAFLVEPGAFLAEPNEPAPPARLLLPRRRKSSSDAP